MNFNSQNWNDLYLYIPDPNYQYNLTKELDTIIFANENIIIAQKQQLPTFAADTWLNPRLITFDSISEAAKLLQPLNDFWAHYPNECVRRGSLIADKLKCINLPKQLKFPIRPLPTIAQFTLLDNNQLIYATERDQTIPDGRFQFVEDKINPPNRAYLKLWEAFSIIGKYPKPGEFAIDVGASPGGWSYVLQSFGAKVLSIDKAPLDPKIAALPNIEARQQSAFSLSPSQFDRVDWLVGDIACYPDRLYKWLLQWIEVPTVKNIILTIKLQGDGDIESLKPFQEIPNSKLRHLCYNKHEVTFYYHTSHG